MTNNQITFNDLPQVVAELRDEVSGMKALLLNLQNRPTLQRENRHRPVTPEHATSVMKTLEKIFSDENLKEYDEFVKILIKEMLEDDTFFFVMSDRNVRKLAQIMAASPHASM